MKVRKKVALFKNRWHPPKNICFFPSSKRSFTSSSSSSAPSLSPHSHRFRTPKNHFHRRVRRTTTITWENSIWLRTKKKKMRNIVNVWATLWGREKSVLIVSDDCTSGTAFFRTNKASSSGIFEDSSSVPFSWSAFHVCAHYNRITNVSQFRYGELSFCPPSWASILWFADDDAKPEWVKHFDALLFISLN